MLAEGDVCEPKPTTVVIPRNASDLRSFYYPTCTRVNRCGGCCGSDLSECAPTQATVVNIKVSILINFDFVCILIKRAVFWMFSGTSGPT